VEPPLGPVFAATKQQANKIRSDRKSFKQIKIFNQNFQKFSKAKLQIFRVFWVACMD
jgi:hypothetical protein